MEDELEGVIYTGFNRLRGTMLGYIESLGLPPKQEKGVKSTFKTLSFEIQEDLHQSLLDMIDDYDRE